MNSALVKILPHSFITSADHKLSTKHLQLCSDEQICQRIIFWTSTIHSRTTGDL